MTTIGMAAPLPRCSDAYLSPRLLRFASVGFAWFFFFLLFLHAWPQADS